MVNEMLRQGLESISADDVIDKTVSIAFMKMSATTVKRREHIGIAEVIF